MGNNNKGGRPRLGETAPDAFYRAAHLLRVRSLYYGPQPDLDAKWRQVRADPVACQDFHDDIETARTTTIEEIIALFAKAAGDLPVVGPQGEGFRLTVESHADAIDEFGFKHGEGGVTSGRIAEKLNGTEADERQIRRHKRKPAYSVALVQEIVNRIDATPAMEEHRITEFDRSVRIEILRRRLAQPGLSFDDASAISRRIAAERRDALLTDEDREVQTPPDK